MTPLEFLNEEFENVSRALGETLRHDYGPERSRPYYEECAARLERIKISIRKIAPEETQTIKDRLDELSSLAMWISLIERSHLGEFSWPFAEELQSISKTLLVQKQLGSAKTSPIIHIIAEGEGYQILDERQDQQVPATSSANQFAVVAFPRPLKHHVLLHTIFGHELGHSALHSTGLGGAGHILQGRVMKALRASGPMASAAAMTSWINNSAAPKDIKAELGNYSNSFNRTFAFDDYDQRQWLDEFICDLCGLLLFGPGFAAAHKTLLNPIYPNPYQFDLADPTHPPYAARHKTLVRAMRLLKWDKPVINARHKQLHRAEQDFLAYVLKDAYDPWAAVFDDRQLKRAIADIQKVFARYGSLAYSQPESGNLSQLIQRLIKRLPPILAEITQRGEPKLIDLPIAHILYAGWVYWVGRKRLLRADDALSFFLTNRLCDHALLQQRAIRMVKKTGAEK